MSSVWISTSGTTLYGQRAGQGPHCILIHGMTLDTRMFDPQWGPFGERVDVVRYDLRGYGRSKLPDGRPYTHRDDLASLLDALGIERTHLVGHSMGGQVALDFAIHHPDRVGRLVLVGLDLVGDKFMGELAQLFDAVRGALESGGVPAAKEVWCAWLTSADVTEAIGAQIRRMVEDWSGWQFTNPGSQTPPHPPTIDRLGEVSAPCLVITGSRDLDDIRAAASILGERLPTATVRSIEGAGHMVNMTAPDEFNRLVLDFLGARS